MHLLAKYFNNRNNFDLTNLTLILNPETLQNDIYKSLNNKIRKAYGWIDALRNNIKYSKLVPVSLLVLVNRICVLYFATEFRKD